ncbi:hypothetical protein [Streptomyces sp. NPDC050560]|uniref:Rv1733c family protein n=1 Tax=Streptomyces sp. NPDC050560 TaxID=3365630 RepID=UPI0037942967
MRAVRVIAGIRRWRHNPLCRPTDLLEAWLMLVTLLAAVLAAPAAGVVTGLVSDRAFQRTVVQQQRQRHPVRAVVVRPERRQPAVADPEAPSLRDPGGRVLAAWKSADGGKHRARVPADVRDPRPGDAMTLWTDDANRVIPRPLTPATASAHAALTGLGAALTAVALVEGVRRLLLWRIMRRRYARWDRAWQQAGPDWGKTGTGI